MIKDLEVGRFSRIPLAGSECHQCPYKRGGGRLAAVCYRDNFEDGQKNPGMQGRQLQKQKTRKWISFLQPLGGA